LTKGCNEGEEDPMGILPCISYGGIEKTCPQYQDEFLEARSGSKWTSQAIAEGLRGLDLLQPLMRDFGAWMCMRPDMYVNFHIYLPSDYICWFQMAWTACETTQVFTF
jgi:hypothetical protein